MCKMIKKMVIVLMVSVFVCVSTGPSVFAQDVEQDKQVEAGKMVADTLIVRPLGLIATVVGGAVFVVSLPFSAIGGNTKPAYDRLVAEPANFTFNRPLGDF